jgi:hypothetical protein
MITARKRRVGNAIGFLAGFLACMYAVREKEIFWPPNVLWASLRNVQRVEFVGGLLLIVIIAARIALQKKG